MVYRVYGESPLIGRVALRVVASSPWIAKSIFLRHHPHSSIHKVEEIVDTGR
jgi:hypothetical protein